MCRCPSGWYIPMNADPLSSTSVFPRLSSNRRTTKSRNKPRLQVLPCHRQWCGPDRVDQGLQGGSERGPASHARTIVASEILHRRSLWYLGQSPSHVWCPRRRESPFARLSTIIDRRPLKAAQKFCMYYSRVEPSLSRLRRLRGEQALDSKGNLRPKNTRRRGNGEG